uniref:Guanine nucleotide-binding protein subunit gamma n=1 Tax=Bubo bubo TaxID=30461 RepID=A0A8C0FXZ4_BUBBB
MPRESVIRSLVRLYWLIRKNPLSVLFLEVSKCSEEIKNYIEERSGEDPLVKGIPEEKNPFKEKGGCVIA